MSNLYTNLRDGLIKSVLSQYGLPVTFVVSSQPIFDPELGVTSSIDESYPCSGIITNYESKDVDGTLIKTGDKRVLLSYTKGMPEPNTDHILTINGLNWPIINCQPIEPGGTAVLYDIQVRR